MITLLSLEAYSPKVIQTNTFLGDINFSYLSSEEAKILLEKEMARKKITLKVGDQSKSFSYGDLGISSDINLTLQRIQTQPSFGMTSILSAFTQKKREIEGNVSIDQRVLKNTILKNFPSLSSQENANSSFFVLSVNQKPRITFNFEKLIAALTYGGEGLRESGIEIETVPSPEIIAKQRKELEEKTLVLRIDGEDVPTLEWKILLSDEGWLSEGQTGISIHDDKLKEFLEKEVMKRVSRNPQDAFIKEFVDEGKATRAIVDGIVRDGIEVPLEENMKLIKNSVSQGTFDVSLKVEYLSAHVYNNTEVELGELELIGVGRSNFAGSPEGRAWNIQKGLREKMNNIIVPPGATFSFNGFLGPMTSAAGWKKALGIFGGGTLAQTVGAGLCQVSTTVYRAILAAGLPVVERKAHSLYVNYYKKYGEGLDSTIFIGGPDLVFINDTPSYLFIQAYDDSDDAYVKIYGTSDGRTAKLDGPYRKSDISPEKDYKPYSNEIVWFRTVQWPDGGTTEETISSRYRTLPAK